MKGNAESNAWRPGRRQDMTRMGRRPGALAILAAAAALALAACGGAAAAPQVASLGTSPGTSSDQGTSASASTPGTSNNNSSSSGGTRATIAGNVTPLLNEWAACERSHGDPDQSDPTVSADGVIHIYVPQGAQPAGDLHERTGTCSQYVAQAANELKAANPVAPPPDQAEQLKYVACMRANGVPNYPYPNGDQTTFNGTGVDPDSPAVQRVNQLCGKKIGAPAYWINGTNTPGDIEVQTAGVHYPLPDSSCAIAKNGCPGLVTVPGSGSGSGSNG
jgi:hypothetical protein